MTNALQKLSDATRMLAEVRASRDPVKAKTLADQASAAKHYAKKHKLGEAAIGHAHSINIEAMALLGEFRKAAPRAAGSESGGRRKLDGTRKEPSNKTTTLADLEITKKESADSQLLATIAAQQPEVFEKIKANQKTITQAKREAKECKREQRRTENKAKVDATPDIRMSGAKFATVVVDPPWNFDDEGDVDQFGRGRPEYHQLSIDELLAFPIPDIADVDCHLYLWITNRSLPKGFALIEKWGFRYITCLTWCKPSFGMGSYFRGSSEHVLFAVKGSQELKRKDVGTWFAAARGPEHSSKPDEFYALVESCSPGPYLDVFGRRSSDNWKVWGADA